MQILCPVTFPVNTNDERGIHFIHSDTTYRLAGTHTFMTGINILELSKDNSDIWDQQYYLFPMELCLKSAKTKQNKTQRNTHTQSHTFSLSLSPTQTHARTYVRARTHTHEREEEEEGTSTIRILLSCCLQHNFIWKSFVLRGICWVCNNNHHPDHVMTPLHVVLKLFHLTAVG